MINHNVQAQGKENLSSALIMALLAISIGSFIYPYCSADSDSKAELVIMIDNVKGTAFEEVFTNQLNYYMSDNDLTNSEFSELEKLYSNYKLSIASGNDKKYIADKNTEFNKQVKFDKEIESLFDKYKLPFLAFIFSIIICIPPFFMYRHFF